MSINKEFNQDNRMELIYNQIVQYTTADFSNRLPVSESGDELDGIIVGLNTLGEELQASGKALKHFEKRVDALMEIFLHYTLMDFSKQVEISEAGDELDAIGVGLNTLVDELKASKEVQLSYEKHLEDKANEILKLNTALENNIIKLENANRELEAFTYSVSHDLRAPLRAIHGYTKIISQDYAGKFDSDGIEMMNAVMRNAKKMGQLIDDLLAFSKIGKSELQKSTINMAQLAELIIKELKNSMPVFKAKVTVHTLPSVIGDYNLISLVLTNLISNAIKYSSAKTNAEVEIGYLNKNNETVYYVKDNGAGFDMQYYDKLFGVFQRLHSSEEFEGTGVGLALVKRIVLRHNGKIWAESKLGEGATFYFSLDN